MKRGLYVLTFACLVAEAPTAYGGMWHMPFSYVFSFLFDWKPLLAPNVDLLSLGFALSAPASPQRRPNPMFRAIQVSIAALFACAAWGLIHGGNSYQMQFQLHTLLSSYLFALAVRRVLRTPEDYLGLGKAVLWAGLYRAGMCVWFYMDVLRASLVFPFPEFCTSHDDSVLFVTALISVLLYVGTFPSPASVRRAAWAAALILAGIQFNNRRLAWVSLVASLAVVFAVMPVGGLRQRFKRVSLRVVPVIALYVVVGWGRPETIFKPLHSLSSVTENQTDPSTRSREMENAGLIVTAMANPWLGRGWGQQYIEVDTTLSARAFEQYLYLPHNSVLALLAFTGILGFAGIWCVFPACAFLALRAVHFARDPTHRLFGLVILAQLVTCMNQMWGDMGFISYTGLFLTGAAFACASHLTSFDPSLMEARPQPGHAAPYTASTGASAI